MPTVYAIAPHCWTNGHFEQVKIGFVHGGVDDVYRRLQQLQPGNPQRLAVWFTTQAPRYGDAWLRRQLEEHRYWREWYYPDVFFHPTMRELIKTEFAREPRGTLKERQLLCDVREHGRFYRDQMAELCSPAQDTGS